MLWPFVNNFTIRLILLLYNFKDFIIVYLPPLSLKWHTAIDPINIASMSR